MYIYKYVVNGGSFSDLVMSLIKNVMKYICVNVFFFEVFFIIKEFLYIVVLNE